jgi:hypothetical protein
LVAIWAAEINADYSVYRWHGKAKAAIMGAPSKWLARRRHEYLGQRGAPA